MLNLALAILAAAGLGTAAFYLITKGKKKILPPEAEVRAREIILEAKDEAFKIKKEAEEEAKKVREKTFEAERRLTRKEEFLEKKSEGLQRREGAIAARQKTLSRKLSEVESLRREEIAKLEKVATLTRDEAKKRLLTELEKDLKGEIALKIKQTEEEAKKEADRKAKEIIVEAIQRSATDYVAEYTTAKVKLPDEEMKGRIIGREGRNIKALERATGADFEIDETPGEVRISCLDPVRREIAKISLEKLIADGRIQPARIEETVTRIKKDLEKEAVELGRNIAYKVGVSDLPPEILSLLGRLKYRTSYGQNQLEHTLEVVNLAKALAQSVGADVELVKKAALLHDLGKVKTVEEEEGTHTQIGRDILKKHGFDERLIHAAMTHHQDEEFKSIEAILVYVADAISSARPGARFEDYETYLKRVGQLEDIAKSFPGVKESYAISAGREVRVIVKPEEIDDAAVVKLSHDIARKIEREAKYPGIVKVNVIRELRAVEVAK